jgi:hypothetical protein
VGGRTSRSLLLGGEYPAATNGGEVYAASVLGRINGGSGMAADSLAFQLLLYQRIHAIVQLDYTFMRRRRFRPYLGLSLRGRFYRNHNIRAFLFERESGRSEEVDAFSTFASVKINDRSLIPRTGFQYDLTNRLSIGTEVNILRDASIGGRWKW